MNNNPPHRPAFVTALAVVVFLLSAANLATVAAAFARRSFFESLNLSLSLWVVITWGVVWGVIWLAAAVGLWRLYRPARMAVLILFPLYQLALLAHQAFLAQGDFDHVRLPFAAASAGLLTLLIIFGLTRPSVRECFERFSLGDKPT